MSFIKTTYLTTAALALLFPTLSTSHAIMNTPTPFTTTTGPKTPQVDPLNGDLYQFPCQLGPTHAYTFPSDATAITAGNPTLLNFTGSAIHGGGSCQISLAPFPPPADPSAWKVIYSIEGGCPAGGIHDNLQTTGKDADGRADSLHCAAAEKVAGNGTATQHAKCVKSYEIPIPSQLKDGKYVFAWTWFNMIGNREMYMNCAPVTVSGGSATDDSYLESLPSVFVANIPGYCTTGEGGSLAFPEPGERVLRSGDVLDKTDAKVVGPCLGGGGGGKGDGEVGSGTPPVPKVPTGIGYPDGPPLPDLDSSVAVPAPSAPGASVPAAAPSGAMSKLPGGVFGPTEVPSMPTGSPSAPIGSETTDGGAIVTETSSSFFPGHSSASGGGASGSAPVAPPVTAPAVASPSPKPVDLSSPSATAPASTPPSAPAQSAPAQSAPAQSAPSLPMPATGGEVIPPAPSVGASAQIPCTQPSGTFYCVSSTSFAYCLDGKATPMQVSQGTICKDGAIAREEKENGSGLGRRIRNRHADYHVRKAKEMENGKGKGRFWRG
ncbi:lytic polysaccharide monooxygenase [Aulographum hederae CBS 113979]|uniref:Lytic polysaccharide monooxygenase n=1 Tax=Aulographum hederae CBS 113979 TaxID=1176131 RepID=A0A6G1GX88_9PEZI|nr:lytic polysaccharide monooxygenase [Aulographum hederae CBS 113979]